MSARRRLAIGLLACVCAPIDPAACPEGQVLEVVPKGRTIRAIAHDDRGNEVLVTVATWHPGIEQRAPKLFFGPPESVLQRRVEAYGVQKDGGTTDILFMLDGERAALTFPTRKTQRPRPPSLEVGGVHFTVSEPTADASDMAGNTYVCAGHPPPDLRGW